MINQTEKYLKAKYLLYNINRSFRRITLPSVTKEDFEKPGYCNVSQGYIDGKSIERVIVILRGVGCQWARDKNGGCIMCGHLAGSSKGEFIPVESLKRQFDNAVAKFNFSRYPMLCLYNGGSFLNEEEIPSDLRRYIINRICNIPGIKRLAIESRPEYITDNILDEIEELLPHTVVEVGVGLESVNDIVRNLILNKNVSIQTYVSLGKKFRNRKSKLIYYILVKPPFLTESEAISDAVASIEFAHEVGADIGYLEPVSVQNHTVVSLLSQKGSFNPPWIWSLFEIIKKVHHLSIEIRIGGFEFFPIPEKFTSNCPACDQVMIRKIKEYNKCQNLEVLEQAKCIDHCELGWKRELSRINGSDLLDRVISTCEAFQQG